MSTTVVNADILYDGNSGVLRASDNVVGGNVVQANKERLLGITGRFPFSGPDDLAHLLPPSLPEPFTTADMAALLGRPRRVAQQLAYCLRAVGVIEAVDAQGRGVAYRLTGPADIG